MRQCRYSGWPVLLPADVAERDPPGAHVVVADDRYGRTLPVREGDRFVATICWSAHMAHVLLY